MVRFESMARAFPEVIGDVVEVELGRVGNQHREVRAVQVTVSCIAER